MQPRQDRYESEARRAPELCCPTEWLLENSKKQVKRLEVEQFERNSSLLEMQSKLDQSNSTREESKKRITNLENEVTRLEGELYTRNTSLQEVNSTREELQRKVLGLEQEIRLTNDEIAQRDRVKIQLEEKLDTLRADLRTAGAEAETTQSSHAKTVQDLEVTSGHYLRSILDFCKLERTSQRLCANSGTIAGMQILQQKNCSSNSLRRCMTWKP